MATQMSIVPSSPDSDWLYSFCEPRLIDAKAYAIDKTKVLHKLDQNECPDDWPKDLKEKICKSLLEQEWNRYPSPYSEELFELLADYAGVSPESVIAGPGSNHLITLLLSTFSKNLKGEVRIGRPSFPLYEQHCLINGIPYKSWDLDDSLNFNVEDLKDLPEHSLVVFASPNNPVGNVLSKNDFKNILKNNPKSLFIADEAYYEFSSDPFTSLLSEFDNLILLRTLSKAMGTAGLRLGYMLASKEIISLMRKVTLPYLLNRFTITAACEVLKDPHSRMRMLEVVALVKDEKARMLRELACSPCRSGYKVFDSEANFLLFKWKDSDTFQKSYQRIVEMGVLARNVSAGPSLAACLRLTIGNKIQNDAVLKIFKDHL